MSDEQQAPERFPASEVLSSVKTWIENRLNGEIKYRQDEGYAPVRNGYSFVEVPEWELRQQLETITRADLAPVAQPPRSDAFFCEHCEHHFTEKPHATDDGYWLCDTCWKGLQSTEDILDDERVGQELKRWQDAIRDKLILLGAPDDLIDGAGCDSGDPLDFTLAEVGQGCGYFIDQLEALRATTFQSPKPDAEAAAREIVREWAEQDLDEHNNSDYMRDSLHSAELEARIASALTSAQQRGSELQREVDAKVICYMCANPERYKPAQPIEGSEQLFHFQGSDNWNAGACLAQAIREQEQQ